MKILFISYAYNNNFPAGTASSRIADALAECGSDLCVISSYHVGGRFLKGKHIMCSSFPDRPSRLFVTLGRLFKREMNYYFWEKRAYTKAKKMIKEWHPDVIYARATPVAVCSVAARLAKQFHVPTIMHFTDPWPSPIEWMPQKVDRQIYSKWMDKILPYATLVSLGNQRMLEYQQKNVRYCFMKKAFVSPDPSPNIEFTYCPRENNSTIRLIFLGKIHGSRNPQPLFEAVKQLKREEFDIELIICEKNNGYEDNEKCIKYVGRTDNVKDVLLSSDILIDIDGDDAEPVFVSSKFKDYINYGRPILSITPNNSPIRELVNGMRTIKCVLNNTNHIVSAIKELQEMNFVESDYEERKNLIASFSPKYIAEDLLRRISILI